MVKQQALVVESVGTSQFPHGLAIIRHIFVCFDVVTSLTLLAMSAGPLNGTLMRVRVMYRSRACIRVSRVAS